MLKPTIRQQIAYQEMIENIDPAKAINDAHGRMIGMIHAHSYPLKVVATLVINGDEHCMEFSTKDDDKMLSYSEAYRDAEFYAAKIIETNGEWEWDDLPKSAA